MRWRIDLFTIPELISDDEHATRVPLRANDHFLLLVPLLNGSIARQALADMLWPGVDPEKQINSFRQRIFRLRRSTQARLLVVDDLVRAADDLAAGAFPPDSALERDPAAWDAELLGPTVAPNVELDDWLRRTRSGWQSRRCTALERIAALAEAAQEFERALAYGRKLLALAPDAETNHQRVIRLHYLRGDRAAAVEAYVACDRWLSAELGVRPSPATLQLLELVERSAAPAPRSRGEVPLALIRPPRLVGRDDALKRVGLACAAGRSIVVHGEGGIGKTRLLQEIAASSKSAAYARVLPHDQRESLSAVGRMVAAVLERVPAAASEPVRCELARLVPALSVSQQPVPPDKAQTELAQAVEALLNAAGVQGLRLLALDDVQHCDAASVDLLGRLVASTRDTGMRWVFGERSATGCAAAAIDPEVERLLLGELDLPAVHELVQSISLPELGVSGLVERLARRAGGNPLFVLEFLRHMASQAQLATYEWSVPSSIHQLIQQRLSGLSNQAMQLAQVAAVAGPDFSVPLAERLMQQPSVVLAEPWRELERKQVLLDGSFTHDLMYEAVSDSIPGVIAKRCHFQIAQLLEESNDADQARLGWHWERSDEFAKAADSYLTAAAAARKVARYDLEFDHLSRAKLAAIRAGRAETAFEASLLGVECERVLLGNEAVVAAAEELCEQAPTPMDQARVLALLAHVHISRADGMLALSAAERGLALVDAASEGSKAWQSQFELSCWAAQACAIQGQHGRGRHILRRIQPWVRDHGSGEQRARYYNSLSALLCVTGPFDEAVEATEAARTAIAAVGNRMECHTATANLGAIRLMAGQGDIALSVAREAIEMSKSLGDARLPQLADRINLGQCCAAVGRFAEAIEVLETTLKDGEHSIWHDQAATTLGLVWVRVGRPERSMALLQDDLSSPPRPIHIRTMRALAKVEVAAVSSAPTRAQTEQAAELAFQSKRASLVAVANDWQRFGPSESAGPATEAALAKALSEGSPIAIAVALVTLAELRSNSRPTSEALSDIERAAAALRRVETQLIYKPDLLMRLSRCATALGAAESAAALTAAAQEWINTRTLIDLRPELRDSFERRHPTNRVILAMARR